MATPDAESVNKVPQVKIWLTYLIKYNVIHDSTIVIQPTWSFPHNISVSTGNRYSHPESEGSCVPPKQQNKAFLHIVKPPKKDYNLDNNCPKTWKPEPYYWPQPDKDNEIRSLVCD